MEAGKDGPELAFMEYIFSPMGSYAECRDSPSMQNLLNIWDSPFLILVILYTKL